MTADLDGPTSGAAGDGDLGRRRIDAVLADDYLDGIEDVGTGVLRQMRDDCREEEGTISYARRVVQGKLDVLSAEVRRRRDSGVASDALDDLPQVLTEGRPVAGEHDLRTRAVSANLRGPGELRRTGERAANIESLGALEELDDIVLAKRIGKLAVEEERLSELRAELLRRIDTLNDEIARRYRDGEADVADVLRPG